MQTVKIRVRNQDYYLSCDSGKEDNLLKISKIIDDRLNDISQKYPKANDALVFVLNAIMMQDEIHDLRKKVSGSVSNYDEEIVVKKLEEIVKNIENLADSIATY